MTTGGEARTAHLTDHLPPTDSLTRPNHVARGVIESRLDLQPIDASVIEEQPVAVRAVVVGPSDNSGVRRAYVSAAGGSEVGAVVKLPDFEDRMEPPAEGGGDTTWDRMKEAVSSRPPDCGLARMCRRRGRASLSFPPDDLSAIRRDQTQPPTDIAQEQQRIEICLTFAQPPVQAALLDFGLAAMPTRAEHPDHLPQGHAFTDMHSADHRLVRAADRAMVDADDRLAADRSYEGHCPARRREDHLTWLGGEINSAMACPPGEHRRGEPSPHLHRLTKRPTGWCR